MNRDKPPDAGEELRCYHAKTQTIVSVWLPVDSEMMSRVLLRLGKLGFDLVNTAPPEPELVSFDPGAQRFVADLVADLAEEK